MMAQLQKKWQKTLQEENDAQKLNIQFKPSGGWTDTEKRCGIVDKNETSGQSFHINQNTAAAWEDIIHPQLMSKYMPKDTFNANDCGLF